MIDVEPYLKKLSYLPGYAEQIAYDLICFYKNEDLYIRSIKAMVGINMHPTPIEIYVNRILQTTSFEQYIYLSENLNKAWL